MIQDLNYSLFWTRRKFSHTKDEKINEDTSSKDTVACPNAKISLDDFWTCDYNLTERTQNAVNQVTFKPNTEALSFRKKKRFSKKNDIGKNLKEFLDLN